MKAPARFTVNVAHGHWPLRGGAASANPARASVPTAPPAMIIATRACATLRRESARRAARSARWAGRGAPAGASLLLIDRSGRGTPVDSAGERDIDCREPATDCHVRGSRRSGVVEQLAQPAVDELGVDRIRPAAGEMAPHARDHAQLRV